MWIGRCGNGEIAVHDQMLSRVSFYSATGAFQRQQLTDAVLIWGCEADGSLIGATSTGASQTEQRGNVVRIAPSGAVTTLATNRLLIQIMMLGARMRASVGAARVVFGNGETPSVTLQRAGTTAPRTVAVGVSNRPPSEAQRSAAIEEWAHVMHGTPADYDRMRRFFADFPSATALPAYNGLFIDDATRTLWVERSVPGAGETILERRSLDDGTLTGLVRVPRDVRPLDVHGGRLVALFQNPETDEEELQVYALP